MTLLPQVEETLVRVAEAMPAARDPWWVIASTAALLHGARPIEIADVDVLLSVADARRVLPAIGITPENKPPHPVFRSEIFGTWEEPPIPVEFMAGFYRFADAGWQPVMPATRVAVLVGEAVVYVPERAELRQMLVDFGRPKDFERVRLLDLNA